MPRQVISMMSASALHVDDKEIVFPSNNGMTIKSGSCVMLTFNLDLSGVILEHTTAQYITRISTADEMIFFFFCT